RARQHATQIQDFNTRQRRFICYSHDLTCVYLCLRFDVFACLCLSLDAQGGHPSRGHQACPRTTR
ncbi:hypothetical protein N9K37_02110, partial [Pseudomonadales bacterium]|nr:hypothetical protein [Pseudomonadales bacterium]